MTFVSLVLIQFFKAYNFRSDRHSVLDRPFANKWLNRAIAVGTAAVGAHRLRAVPARAVRHVPRCRWRTGCIIIGLAFTVVPVLEVAKWLIRRQQRQAPTRTQVTATA